jgi:hypothetical protein
MSRTDRHRPYHVQAEDPYEQDKYWFPDGEFSRWVVLYRTCCCRQYWCCSTEPNRHHRRSLRHQDQQRARAAVKGELTAWDGRLRPRRW